MVVPAGDQGLPHGSNRAICVLLLRWCRHCERQLAVSYRVKMSMAFSDSKRVHIACLSSLPIATKTSDSLVFRRWSEMPELAAGVYEMLDAASLVLAPPAAAAAASSAG